MLAGLVAQTLRAGLPGPAAAPAAAASDKRGYAWTLLQRHGQRPLGFRGRLLFQAQDRSADVTLQSEIAVHETDDDRFVVAIRHRTLAAGVAGTGVAGTGAIVYADAQLCGDTDAVHACLGSHDPLQVVASDLLAGPADLRQPDCSMRRSEMQRAAWRMLVTRIFGPVADAHPK